MFISFIVFTTIKKWFKGGVCRSKTRMDGKTVLITGGNSGIGKETARDIAKRGARLILASRDVEKTKRIATEITRESGNENIVVKRLDLGSLQSVRNFAAEIIREESHLDVLINNAGVMCCPYSKTEEGFEMHFGVNHLGHFLLTHLLLDLLKKSAPSRIVVLSSLVHILMFGIHFDDINSEKSYNSWIAYCHSKLANLMFTRELAKKLKGTGVTVNAVHPGIVVTELTRYLNVLVKYFVILSLLPILKNERDGAQTSIHCAVADELENVSGLYFSDCAPKKPTRVARDDEAAKRLWELSERMVGLKE
uniref:Retinol dehydrogenase 12-like n=1 Tax=Saccoglossus kowalevskii TaxID=10224 RepID=A0ABM0M1P7_SACKO|nr:PREDICTED: retinol dehydrogenase 12-like [Saccoglossus kowalevskii]